MRRLREKAGLGTKAGERVVLYSHRHTAATEWVGNAASDLEVAALLGHTTTRTLQHYYHNKPDHLRFIQRRAKGR
jgi:integrase